MVSTNLESWDSTPNFVSTHLKLKAFLVRRLKAFRECTHLFLCCETWWDRIVGSPRLFDLWPNALPHFPDSLRLFGKIDGILISQFNSFKNLSSYILVAINILNYACRGLYMSISLRYFFFMCKFIVIS